MTRTEHLLVILMEECAEVAHRASKCLRFGFKECEPGHGLSNINRLQQELDDLNATARLTGLAMPMVSSEIEQAKHAKIERFLAHSRECGTLKGPDDAE